MLHLLAYSFFYIYGTVTQNNLGREESIITFGFGIKIKKKIKINSKNSR
jgi:hypothetical protein